MAEVELAFELSESVPDGLSRHLENVVATLAAAGQRGAYPLPTAAPADSRMVLLHGPLVSPIGLSFRLQVRHVDPRAYQLVRNMAYRSELAQDAVSRILVLAARDEAARVVELPVPNDENEDDVYPGLSDRGRIEVEWVNTEFSKSRRCLVLLAREPQTDDLSEIGRCAQLWGTLLEASAFALPAGFPGETESYAGAVTQFDSRSVEIEVARLEASETAWNPLINLLEAWGGANAMVESVIVE
jgi:hypothetical protein